MRARALSAVVLVLGGWLTACHGDPPPAPLAQEPGTVIPSPCVYFEDLRAFLPAELAGFKRVRDEGSTGKYGDVSVSEAERTFSGDAGQQLSVRIVDTTLGKRLGQAIRDAATDARGRPSTDPTAPFTGEQTVGFVRFDPQEQKSEANLLVGDRYVVAVSGLGFEGTEEVRRIASGLNLAGLSKLR